MSASANSQRTVHLSAFGARLRALREDCKIKQRALAKELEISTSTLSNRERGTGVRAPEWTFVQEYVNACRSALKKSKGIVDSLRFDLERWRADHAALEQALDNIAKAGPAIHSSARELGRQKQRQYASAGLRQRHTGHGADVNVKAHQSQVADIAPARLLERDHELAALAQFCTEEHAYAWWQGQPWAGKTALLSWFTLHPPEGVDVVSFFAISNIAGQSDSNAFVNTMTEQLAPLAGEPSGMTITTTPHKNLLRLLRDAGQRLSRAGRRLLIVVDGLDEDTSSSTGIEQRSIASLLPRRSLPGVQVLVASRHSPGLPDDVPGDHPLRLITPRQLTASPHAVGLQQAARNELHRALRRPGIRREILGLITASGGSLTVHDLEELTKKPPHELAAQLDGLLGRTVASMTKHAEPASSSERVYVFAHKTLREEAEHKFGTSRIEYDDRLRHWADCYRVRGWPAETPMYLIRDYRRMLALRGNIPGLLSLVTDSVRHQRMFQATGGDALALAEIASTARLLSRHYEPDLAALMQLAMIRDQFVHRYRRLPTALPIAWAAVGEPGRGIALAHCLPDLFDRAHALGAIARAQATAGHPHQATQAATDAEATARTISDHSFRLRALATVAELWAVLGNRERVAAAVSEVQNGVTTLEVAPLIPILVSCLITRAWATLGDCERAVEAADSTRDRAASLAHPSALVEVAAAWAAAGEPVRAAVAASTVEAITSTREPSWAATAWTAARDYDLAEQFARSLTYAPARDAVFSDLVRALSASGERDRAEQLAHRIDAPASRVAALSVIAEARAAAGQPESAAVAATASEAAAETITDAKQLTEARCAVAVAWAAAGNHPRAMRAVMAAQAGDWSTRAPDNEQEVIIETAKALASAGDPERAEKLAQAITDPRCRFDALVLAAQASAVTGVQERAVRLLTAAEAIAQSFFDPACESSAADESSYPGWTDSRPLLPAVAEAWASIGESGRAGPIADDSSIRPKAIVELARVQKFAAEGNYHTAEQIACSIADVPVSAVASVLVAQSSAAARDYRRAAHVAQSVSDLAETVADPLQRAQVLGAACEAWAAAGNKDLILQSAQAIEAALTELSTANHSDPEAAKFFLIQGSCIMARAWSLAADRDRAVRAAITAETTAASSDTSAQAQALGQAAVAWVSAGDASRAAHTMAAAQAALAKPHELGMDATSVLKLAEISARPEVHASLRRAQRPEVMSAQRLLAAMISTSDWDSRESGAGTWLIALRTIGKANLSALQRFGDVLLAKKSDG
ncbi:helix-turn-helix domain-containing protein [Nonomuraea sp. NPDC050790]|uniref:helix-turn-helix domain-containing protein n=1 Tax=Nonomuraea sp. NPDC050790 TaxID=3364371 RepID=UPI0037A00140